MPLHNFAKQLRSREASALSFVFEGCQILGREAKAGRKFEQPAEGGAAAASLGLGQGHSVHDMPFCAQKAQRSGVAPEVVRWICNLFVHTMSFSYTNDGQDALEWRSQLTFSACYSRVRVAAAPILAVAPTCSPTLRVVLSWPSKTWLTSSLSRKRALEARAVSSRRSEISTRTSSSSVRIAT